jgi:hypothetical protein
LVADQTVSIGGRNRVSAHESSELVTEGFWSAGRLVAAALALLWACFFLSGIDGLIAFHDREPGLPIGDHLGTLRGLAGSRAAKQRRIPGATMEVGDFWGIRDVAATVANKRGSRGHCGDDSVKQFETALTNETFGTVL